SRPTTPTPTRRGPRPRPSPARSSPTSTTLPSARSSAATRSACSTSTSSPEELAGEDGDAGGAGRTVELGVADLGVARHLAVAGLTAQLAHPLVDLAQPRRADRLAVGDEPTVGVDRHRAVDLGRAVGDQRLLVAVGAEAVLRHVDHLGT